MRNPARLLAPHRWPRQTWFWMMGITLPGTLLLYFLLQPVLAPVLVFTVAGVFYDSGQERLPRFITFRYEIQVRDDACVHRINRAINSVDSDNRWHLAPVGSLLPGIGEQRSFHDSIVVPAYLPGGNYRFELLVFSDCRWGPTRFAQAPDIPFTVAP